MIKKLLLALAIILPLSALAQGKFGIVNTNEIFTVMPETAKAQADLDAAQKKYEGEFKGLTDEYQKKVNDFQALPADTPDAIKERRVQEIGELEQRIQDFRQKIAADLQRQQEALLAPIQQKIMDAIKLVGEEGNFTFIFENMVPVFAGKDVTDVTPLVKAKLGLK